MTQAIIFTNSNGGVSVCIPTGELPIEAVQLKDTPKGSLIVEQSALPNQYSDFFDAWELVDGSVTVSLDKAKEITKKRLRAEREPLLAAQDVAFQAFRHVRVVNTHQAAVALERCSVALWQPWARRPGGRRARSRGRPAG